MNDFLAETKEKMNKTIECLVEDLSKVRTGRVNASILDRVEVNYYGFKTPINQTATISVNLPNQLVVRPFDRSTINDIEKAIKISDLGLNPNSDGEIIRIIIPQLTEERRKELTKVVSTIGEENKVSIRNIRRGANDYIKAQKDSSEDEKKNIEKKIQEMTDNFIKKIDELVENKKKEILTI